MTASLLFRLAGYALIYALLIPPSSATTIAAVSDAEIRALFEEWNATLLSGDPGVVADRYTENAILLPTLSNRIRHTREGIVDYFEHFLAHHPIGRIEQGWIRVFDDVAIDSGMYVFEIDAPDGGRVDFPARYTFVYVKHDGDWRIIEHHSSAMPETPRAPPGE